MAKKFCLLYFPFVPSQSGQEGGGGGGGGGGRHAHNSQGTWPFSDSPVDYFDILGIVSKLTLIFCLY